MFTFEDYRTQAKGTPGQFREQFEFYQSLWYELSAVPYSDPIVQAVLGDEAPDREKEIYFSTAKELARLLLELCEQGAYLAVDPAVKKHYDNRSPDAHRKAIAGFAKEARRINRAVLRFTQVEEGISHLEELVKTLN